MHVRMGRTGYGAAGGDSFHGARLGGARQYTPNDSFVHRSNQRGEPSSPARTKQAQDQLDAMADIVGTRTTLQDPARIIPPVDMFDLPLGTVGQRLPPPQVLERGADPVLAMLEDSDLPHRAGG
jgi:hypothetical protein